MPLPVSDMERIVDILELTQLALIPNSWLYTRINYIETSIDPLAGTNTLPKIQSLLTEIEALNSQIDTVQSGSGLASSIDIDGEYSVSYENGVNQATALRDQKDKKMRELCRILNIGTSPYYQGRTTRG